MIQEENDEAGDEDPDMEGELTSADVRKLQSLVDEQEQAVQAGMLCLLCCAVLCLLCCACYTVHAEGAAMRCSGVLRCQSRCCLLSETRQEPCLADIHLQQ